MTSLASHEQADAAPRRPRILLRDAADINRLIAHLFTHLEPPSVDVRIDQLPAVDSQRAQDRFRRLRDDCNCLLGEMLGGLTLLGGWYAAWVWWGGWAKLVQVTLAGVGVALAGKAIERAATRLKLLRALWKLRRRLADTIAGRIVHAPAEVPESRPYLYPFNREDSDVLHEDRLQRAHLSAKLERPRIPVRDAGDITRVVLHLLTHWKLPYIDVQADALPRRIVERAQDRFVRLSAGYSYLLAGLLAAATLVGGLIYILAPPAEAVLWTLPPNWSAIPVLLLFALLAALLGCVIEVLWIRLRLLGVSLGLRRRMRTAQPA